MLAVNPDAANRDDVARLASELGNCLRLLEIIQNKVQEFQVREVWQMTTPKTAHEWLAEPDLPTKLAKAFDEKGKRQVKHTACWLCSIGNCTGCEHYDIKIDWNTAKYWQGKCDSIVFDYRMEDIHKATGHTSQFYYWYRHIAQPKHYLIAAAMARTQDG